MKKVKFILTMLVVISGVMFSTNANAQGQTLPYTMTTSTDIVSDGWVDSGNTTPNVNFTGTQGNPIWQWAMATPQNATVSYEKPFDLNGITDLSISYNAYMQTPTNSIATFTIYIDGSPIITESNVSSVNNTYPIMNTGTFSSTSVIRIDIDYIGISSNVLVQAVINSFHVENASVITSVNEINLSDNLNIYSYDKSIYVSSNGSDNINAEYDIYNLSGQIVKADKVNISTSKSEIKLDELKTGMYILMLNDGVSVTRKKIIIN